MASKQGRFPPGLARAAEPAGRSAGKVASLTVLVALGVQGIGEKVSLGRMTAGAGSMDGCQLCWTIWPCGEWGGRGR